jgi:predicted ABC-type ATPase
VDTDEAVRRAVARAAETGRHVPEGMMRRTHAAVSDTFREVSGRGLFDELRLWDTNASTPRLIYENIGGRERILDAAAYRAFLRKGTNFPG